MSLSWTGRRVLVTGAGGFIGSHLAGRLADLGADVRALVRYRSDHGVGLLAYEPAAGDIEVVSGDLRDPDYVRQAVRDCEVVFHLAAQVGIPYSYRAPREVIETNVLGTLNVLLAAADAGARVIATSTSEVYGTPETLPISEASRLRAQSPYAASKIGADALAESLWRSHGIEVGTLRPFNTYGPRQSARAVIPTIVTQALAGGAIRIGSLDPVRDFTFVEDTVTGFLAFGELPDIGGRTIQLGTGEAVSVGTLIELVGDAVGRKLDVETDPERVRPTGSEVDALVSDPETARQLLGWSPATALADGLARTIEWIDAHRELYPPPGTYAV